VSVAHELCGWWGGQVGSRYLELDEVWAVLAPRRCCSSQTLPGFDDILDPQLCMVPQGDGGGLLCRELLWGVEDHAEDNTAARVKAGPAEGGDENGSLVRLQQIMTGGCKIELSWRFVKC
jgi:hypothetical protein